ncbi:MAG: ATP-binding protein [Gammaproteobacteria bacterium]|nr:ATP-binding protein [Gammaproteobacteria bacterium]MDE0489227.1 ATP-binding protein [Gammaproteobacteria bacterium]
MSSNTSSFEIGIEFDSVLRAISKQIYETPHAFLRENVQNAIDAVRIQALRDGRDAGDLEYRIEVQVDSEIVSVRDNGIGMSRKDLQGFFWTIGSSGKRGDEARKAGCVGMFGIGGFANFGVCHRLVVTSKDVTSTKGTSTALSAEDIRRAGTSIPKVTIADSGEADPRGTLVVGELKNPPDIEELKNYLRDFVRFVPVDIRFNGESISRGKFEALDEQDNLVQIGEAVRRWESGDAVIFGRLWEDRGHTLVASIEEFVWRGNKTLMKGRLRFEGGLLDAFKRGFKLCATQVPTTIGVSGRLDCDLFVPTAGRDSLDSETMGLLGQLVALLEQVAVDVVLESPERIAQHTRIFRYISRRGLIEKMANVPVRLANGTEATLGDVRRRASSGGVSVFYGTARKHALSQVMHAQGHIVVQLSADRYRQAAERSYLEQYCTGKAFDGVVDCAEFYHDLSIFERVFLSEVERNIMRSYEIRDFDLIAGKLTEDIPSFVREKGGHGRVDVIVDVRHAEVTKLKDLGLNDLVYSLISIFCREYIGPALKKWSPKFFGDGALNLEMFARRRSELWVLVKDDIGVVRKGGQRQVVTQQDVAVINVANQEVTQMDAKNPHRLLLIVDEDDRTNLSGHYIRLPGWAYDAYGDLVLDCDARGVVWTGNRVTFVASDGVSAQFQYDIRLDEIVGVDMAGVLRAEGALELNRPLQSLFDGLYFPIPIQLTRFLVPSGSEEIRLDLHCEWVDMRSRQLWEAAAG